MPTVIELNEQLEAKRTELFALSEKADPTPADAEAGDKIGGEIDAIEAQIKGLVDAKTKMAAHRARAAEAKSFQSDPADKGLPFNGRIDAGTAEADTTKSLNDWLKCVGMIGSAKAPAQQREAAEQRLDRVYKAGFKSWDNVKAALSEQTGITGGYVAPPEY
jgi:hypothetical protein